MAEKVGKHRAHVFASNRECPAIRDVVATSQSIIETAPKFWSFQQSSTAFLHEQGNTERYEHAYPRVMVVRWLRCRVRALSGKKAAV